MIYMVKRLVLHFVFYFGPNLKQRVTCTEYTMGLILAEIGGLYVAAAVNTPFQIFDV